MKRIAVVTALLLASSGLAACGEKEEPIASSAGSAGSKHLRLLLDYFPNADHVGIYKAQADGDFRDAGLDVDIKPPPDAASPLKLLAAGKADLAISYEPELLLARDKGLRLASVGALVQVPLTSIISLPAAKIDKPADLADKKVGTAGIPYQSAYIKAVLEKAGEDPLSVDEINVGFNLVPALLSKKADAVLGAYWNYEAIDLKLRKRNPHVIRIEQAGVPTYAELVVVARKEYLAHNGGIVRRFMRALALGYEAVRTSPKAGVLALVKANPDLNAKLQLASVRATLPVFFPRDDTKPFGYQRAADWERFGSWMLRNELVEKQPNAGSAMTNEFLPGEGF
jgi:putative hydroxymethylpyrimidine transport system substrate-binding protein